MFVLRKHIETRPSREEERQRLQELSKSCLGEFDISLLGPDGQPGMYCANKSGEEILVANFAPLVLEGTQHITEDGFEDTLTILCIRSDGEAFELWDVTLGELSAKAFQNRLGMKSGAYCSNPQIFDHKIQDLIYAQITERGDQSGLFGTQYHFTGRLSYEDKYICQDKTVLTPLEMIDEKVLAEAPGEICKLIEQVEKLMPNDMGVIILAVRSLASILSYPTLIGKPKPSFGLILLGETGSKKTSTVKALCCMREWSSNMTNFKSTPSAVQSVLSQTRDDVVLVDDMYPAKITSERNQQREIFSLLVRAVGDEGGTRQKIQSGGVSSGSSSCLFIITGEQMIACSESDIWRTIILNLSRADVNLDALTWLQENMETLQFYTRLFVEYITLNKWAVYDMCDYYKKERAKLLKKFQEENQWMPDRLVSNWAWLNTGINALREFLEVILYCSNSNLDASSLHKKWLRSVQSVVYQQFKTYGEIGTIHRIMNILREIYEEEPGIFVEINMGENRTQIACDTDKALGFYYRDDPSYVYLRTESILKCVQKRCAKYNFDDLGIISPRKFRSLLDTEELIAKEAYTQTGYTKSIRVNKKNIYVTVVDREKLERLIGKIGEGGEQDGN